jgi:hypothetical protein
MTAFIALSLSFDFAMMKVACHLKDGVLILRRMFSGKLFLHFHYLRSSLALFIHIHQGMFIPLVAYIVYARSCTTASVANMGLKRARNVAKFGLVFSLLCLLSTSWADIKRKSVIDSIGDFLTMSNSFYLSEENMISKY